MGAWGEGGREQRAETLKQKEGWQSAIVTSGKDQWAVRVPLPPWQGLNTCTTNPMFHGSLQYPNRVVVPCNTCTTQVRDATPFPGVHTHRPRPTAHLP